MNPLQQHSVAFTGHRTYRGEADELLRHTIEALAQRGLTTFLSGMASGFDLAAAEAVVALKQNLPALQLHAVVPFAEHGSRLAMEDRKRYERLLRIADRVTLVSESYHSACYHLRNDFLVDHACYVVAWYNGSPGGTRYTLHRARCAHLPIENLWPDPQLKIIL